MSKIHDDFTKTIKDLRFKRLFKNELEWQYYDGTWLYKLTFEGYAYVLYKEIKIYKRPINLLFRFYNKFKKSSAEIRLTHDVPIAHFHEPKKLIAIMEILTDKLEVN